METQLDSSNRTMSIVAEDDGDNGVDSHDAGDDEDAGGGGVCV